MNQQPTNPVQNWVDALRSGQAVEAVVEAGKLAANQKIVSQVSEATIAGGSIVAGGSENRAAQATGVAALPDLHVGRGMRYGNLTWFPVFTNAPVGQRSYVTVASAAKVGVVENSTPSVGHLQVRNDGNEAVLLFEGALLEGGWQHRALTHTVWVAAKTTAEIPVVCVEAGRWNGVSTQNFGNKTAPARVRRAMRGIKLDAHGTATQSRADQNDVWNEVNTFATKTSKLRPTQSLVEMADEIQQDIAQLGLQAPTAIFGQRGVLVAVAGKPLALEVFDHPDTLAERLESILDAYLPESMALPYSTCRSQLARDFAARVEALGAQPTENAGRLRNKPDKYVASEVVLNDQGQFLHLATLNPAHELVLAA
ncbi:MAG: hypothetical protein RLZ28_1361 [Actinomycetota bacterium]